MSDLTREALVAEAEKVNAARTPGPWEFTDGVVWTAVQVPIMVPVCCNRPTASGECCGSPDAGQDWEVEQQKVCDTDPSTAPFIAFCGTHMTTLLSLLASEGAKVKALEEQRERTQAANRLLKADRDRLTAEVERLNNHILHMLVSQEQNMQAWAGQRELREKAEAEVTRLTAEVKRLKHGGGLKGLTNEELEAQR